MNPRNKKIAENSRSKPPQPKKPKEKRSKAKKLLSEDYESVVNSIQELIFIVDTAARIVGFNDKFAKSIVPCQRSKALGENFSDILKNYWGESGLEDGCKRAIDEILVRGKYHREKDFIKPSAPNFFFVKGRHGSEEGLFKVRAFPSFGKDGIIRRIVCVVNDVTKLRIADENLRKVMELNEKILKNTPVGIVTINTKGVVTYTNSHLKHLVGDRHGKNIFNMDFIRRCGILEGFENLLCTGENFFKTECPYFNKKKQKKVYFNVRMVPLKNDLTKEIDGAVTIVDDVTYHVESRKQIENLNQNLENKIMERTKQLKEAINLKTRFIADASHELRTPLTIMRGNLDLLYRKKIIDGEAIDMIQTVEDQVDHMSKMLVDLTMLAKGDGNLASLELDSKKVDLAKTVNAITRAFTPAARKYDISLEITNILEKAVIIGDQDKIERLINNLISNAIKYGKKKGFIKIKLDEENRHFVLSIADDGVGISKKDLPYIFERFYRTDQARHKNEGEGGTGLGLAICKWIVEIHGGAISVNSSLNKGSVFTVKLPVKNNS